jgi:Putative transmembrane protein (PGPGW)
MEWQLACTEQCGIARRSAASNQQADSVQREETAAMLIRTVEQAKRWAKIVMGFTLLVLGVVLFFSPAPGLLVALLGLGILGAEFVWAKRLLNHLKEQGERLRQTVFARVDKAA